MLESILADFQKFLGVRAVKGSGNFENYFLLKISDREEVWIKDTNPGVLMRSILTPTFSKATLEDFYIYLMKANFLGQGTGGSVISIDPNEKFLTLSLSIPYEVNYRQVRDRFEDFLNYVDYWREEIKTFETRQH